MGANRRFFANEGEVPVFIFTIDTTKIVSGATNGSENPLTFRLPVRNGYDHSAVIKIDGLPDKSITKTTSRDDLVITFPVAGIYQIKVVGRLIAFGFNQSVSGYAFGYDLLKIVSIDKWGASSMFIDDSSAFDGCSNLVIKANNTLKLPPNSNNFFRGIKGFDTSLELIDTSGVTSAQRLVYNNEMVLNSLFNPFWSSMVYFTSVYSANTFGPSVNKIEIISDTLVTLSEPWLLLVFQNTGTIRLICKTPNLKTMFRVFRNGDVKTRCHAGEIDVRNVTDTSGWLSSTFTKAQVDATLLGWANLPFMQSGVTWNWNGSKYSNNPAVIAAYNKITTTWGVIFTNLTME